MTEPGVASAWVALGANKEDARATLAAAVKRLRALAVEPLKVSSLYETSPVGGPPQDNYLNAAVGLRTRHAPLELLRALQRLELEFGRTREVRWGARTLDLDLLLYEGERLTTPELILPHPRLHQRRFVLVPLVELDPTLVPPGLVEPVAELLRALPAGEERVQRIADPTWGDADP